MSLKREVWVVKAGHSILPTPSQHHKFSDEKKLLVLFSTSFNILEISWLLGPISPNHQMPDSLAEEGSCEHHWCQTHYHSNLDT